ncbi:MAG: DUF2079 domain-containing protein [Kiritimatiellae bacterium]|nr:DUF2079 domain-containing protein [Kiritimatiellia bacterium]
MAHMHFNDRSAAVRLLNVLRARAWRGLPALLIALCALAVLCEIAGVFSAMTWQKLGTDHGRYTTMIWNCAHGAPFRYEVDRSYLATHLSFSLALIGPLFRVWDHPFLLCLVQCLLLAGGAAVLWHAGRRAGLPPLWLAALACFYVAYPMAQSVVLVEFHGVGLYLLTVPWLYAALAGPKPGHAWVPLALTLGAREDAFLVVLPMLIYFAVRTRRPMAITQTVAALAYGLAALFWIYPAINGASLFAVRSGWIPGAGAEASAAAPSAC